MGKSLIADAPFEHHKLLTIVHSDKQEGVDEHGNPVYEVVLNEVNALLTPSGGVAGALDTLVHHPGADAVTTPVKGELVEPLEFPLGFSIGSIALVNWHNTPMAIKLTSVTPNDLINVPFGASFAGRMRRIDTNILAPDVATFFDGMPIAFFNRTFMEWVHRNA